MEFPALRVVILMLFTLCMAQKHSDKVCMVVPKSTQECFRSFQGKPISQLAAKVSCLQDLLWNFKEDRSLNEKDHLLLRNFSSVLSQQPSVVQMSARKSGLSTDKYLYPPTGHRTRKEYRLLTPEERDRFHSVLNRMYQDGFIETFAKIHEQAGDRHHGGASFLPWHRIMLLVFEEIMRQYDRHISLPYWASSLDNNMDNPVNSIIWTPQYFGTGDGLVDSGPSAGWVTDQGRLERMYGRGGRLIRSEDIDQVLTQCRMSNISTPTASSRFNLEFFHNGPHVWVGGDMSSVAKTAYDPIFYMHHAFVDYVWEQFRRHQKRLCNIDPATDYPDVVTGDVNHPNAEMVGFEWFSNKDGIKEQWTKNWYDYEPEPTCPDCCPGCPRPTPLYCHRRINKCIPRSKYVRGLKRPRRLTRQRNRGRLFESPASDKRTIFTVDADVQAFEMQHGSVDTTGTGSSKSQVGL